MTSSKQSFERAGSLIWALTRQHQSKRKLGLFLIIWEWSLLPRSIIILYKITAVNREEKKIFLPLWTADKQHLNTVHKQIPQHRCKRTRVNTDRLGSWPKLQKGKKTKSSSKPDTTPTSFMPRSSASFNWRTYFCSNLWFAQCCVLLSAQPAPEMTAFHCQGQKSSWISSISERCCEEIGVFKDAFESVKSPKNNSTLL